MASRQQIKRRIGSVKNTRQLTKAMQLVAASKLRRAQEAVGGPRAYADMARSILLRLRQISGSQSELFVERPVKIRLLLVVTSDRGLAGAYNANVIRRMISEIKEDRDKGVNTKVIAIGRRVANAASRIQGLTIEAAYPALPDKPNADQLRPILNTVVDAFIEGHADAVDIINTRFVSTVQQQVQLRRLLPAGTFDQDEQLEETTAGQAEITAEPSPEALINSVTRRLLEVQIYQALLDAIASEHSMRMLAMKSATDNAGDLIEDLTLAYNNARQAAITQELAEITGGSEAMK